MSSLGFLVLFFLGDSSSPLIVHGPNLDIHQKRIVLKLIVNIQRAAVTKNCNTRAVSLAGGLPQISNEKNIPICTARPIRIEICVNNSIFCSVAKVRTFCEVFTTLHHVPLLHFHINSSLLLWKRYPIDNIKGE